MLFCSKTALFMATFDGLFFQTTPNNIKTPTRSPKRLDAECNSNQIEVSTRPNYLPLSVISGIFALTSSDFHELLCNIATGLLRWMERITPQIRVRARRCAAERSRDTEVWNARYIQRLSPIQVLRWVIGNISELVIVSTLLCWVSMVCS
jgi:hypothetical protein